MSSSTANAAYTKILDATYDSKVLQGLLRILPESFRVVKGTATIGTTGSGDSVAVNDAAGNPILLNAGEIIVSASVAATTTMTSGGSATLTIGSSNVAAGSGVTADSNILETLSLAEVNGTGELPGPLVRLVPADEQYLIAEVGTAAATAGVVEVVLVIV